MVLQAIRMRQLGPWDCVPHAELNAKEKALNQLLHDSIDLGDECLSQILTCTGVKARSRDGGRSGPAASGALADDAFALGAPGARSSGINCPAGKGESLTIN